MFSNMVRDDENMRKSKPAGGSFPKCWSENNTAHLF